MELSGYFKVARRWWWTLLVATWIGGLAGYFVSMQIPLTYEARAGALVGPVNADTDTLRASGQLVQTYAVLAVSRPTLEGVIADLGLPMTPDDLEKMVRVTANDITRILTIRVQDVDPGRAADIANTVADRTQELATSGAARPEGSLQLVSPAVADPRPVAPQVSLFVALAAFAGLLGALVVVLIIEYMNTTVRDPEDLGTNGPFLGLVRPRATTPDAVAATVEHDPASPAAGDYRALASRVAYSASDGASTLLVVGADNGDGPAWVAANLAATFAKGGRVVTLVDANWMQKDVSAIFGLKQEPGLREALAGDAPTSLVTYPTAIASVSVVPAGRGDAPEVIDPRAARKVTDGMLLDATQVVIAAAGVRMSAATLGWARIASGVVVTAERYRVRRSEVAETADALAFVGARVIGWVLTDSRVRTRSRRGLRRRDSGGGARAERPAARTSDRLPGIITDDAPQPRSQSS